MTLNRLIDADIDGRNPRTAGRALPRGRLSRTTMWLAVALALLALGVAAWRLNPLCLALSPLALALLFLYSYTKRFTWTSHLLLGLVLACAPVGGWVGATGSLALPPVILGVAVLFWLAGFDIIYACQDEAFDREAGLRSIPETFGLTNALRLSAVFHGVMLVALVAVGWMLQLSLWYQVGCGASALLLGYQHAIVSPSNLSRVDTAFFSTNAVLSVVLFGCTLLSLR